MLQTVKNYISSMPDISFDKLYLQYILSVDYAMCELEQASLFRNNPDVDVLQMIRLVNEDSDKLVKLYDRIESSSK